MYHLKQVACWCQYLLRDNCLLNKIILISEYVSDICVSYFGWLIPVCYLLYKSNYYFYVLYKLDLKFRFPLHIFHTSSFQLNEWHRIIELNDFKKAKQIGTCEPMLRWSNFTKHNNFTYFKRLNRIKELLGVTRINKCNLALETVHNTYAGAGLKSLLTRVYSSIVVQIVTKSYSMQHRRKMFCQFSILVISGIGIVVWYKYQPHPPQAYSYHAFQNPTAVVEGFRKVSYWMNNDIEAVIKNAFTHERPFNEIINLPQYWGTSVIEKDQITCIGTAIIIATLMSLNLLH
jgi:hypothetical protein